MSDIARWVNILMALACLGLLTRASWHRWGDYTTKMKNYVMALGGLCMVIIESNLEFLFPDFMPNGLRILLTFFLLLFLLTGLLRNEGYIKSDDPPSK